MSHPTTKAYMREVFGGALGAAQVAVPHDVLWRAKAMQCEGVGEGWVELLQVST